AVVGGGGGEAERGSRAARGGFGAAAALLAAGEVAAGGEAEPGGEVFFRGPPGHVEADLADHGEGGGGVDAIDPGEVDPGEAMQVLAGVGAVGRASGRTPTGRGGPRRRAGLGRGKRGVRPRLATARRRRPL